MQNERSGKDIEGPSAPLFKSGETGGGKTRQGQMSVGRWFGLC